MESIALQIRRESAKISARATMTEDFRPRSGILYFVHTRACTADKLHPLTKIIGNNWRH